MLIFMFFNGYQLWSSFAEGMKVASDCPVQCCLGSELNWKDEAQVHLTFAAAELLPTPQLISHLAKYFKTQVQ